MDQAALENHFEVLEKEYRNEIADVLSEFGYKGEITPLSLLAAHKKHGSEFTMALDQGIDYEIGFGKLLTELKRTIVKGSESFKGKTDPKNPKSNKNSFLIKTGVAIAVLLVVIYLVMK